MTPPALSLQRLQPEAARAPTRPAMPPAEAAPSPPAGCGWFESSHDLQQGAAVQECPTEDWSVLLLHFGQLLPSDARLR